MRPERPTAALLAALLCSAALAPAPEEPTHVRTLEGSDARDRLGAAVATFGSLAAVVAVEDDEGGSRGTVHLFDRETGAHVLECEPAGSIAGGSISTVALWSGLVVAGSPRYDDGANVGTCYVFDAQTGGELRRLRSDDLQIGDGFGAAVGLDDGKALVGSPYHNASGVDDGVAHLFDPYTGDQLMEWTASDAAPDDHFGAAVSIRGGVAVVGAPGDDDAGAESGSAYVFDVATGAQLAKLLPADGAAGDGFGSFVATDGTTIVVGAPGDDDAGADSGSAYLFDAATGAQTAKLVAGDAASGDAFGSAVDVDDALAVVGAPGHDGAGAEAGALYVFETATGAQRLQHLAGDGAAGDLFGASACLRGGIAIVGASGDEGDLPGDFDVGAAYVVRAANGTETAKLRTTDEPGHQLFGAAAALNGSRLLVGAPGDHDLGEETGSAYLLERSTGERVARLVRPSPPESIELGSAVAFRGSLAIVGHPGYDGGAGLRSGTVWTFDGVSGAWLGQWVHSEPFTGRRFGESLAVRGSRALVGAPGTTYIGGWPGTAYLYETSTGTELRKLTPNDGVPRDLFAFSLALTDTYALVGAPGRDDQGDYSGAAYLFDPSSGAQLAKLLPDDGGLNRLFGWAVALGEEVAVVSDRFQATYTFDLATGQQLARLGPAVSLAVQDGLLVRGTPTDTVNGPNSGSVSLHDARSGALLAKIVPADGAGGDQFGSSVALQGSTLLVGAPRREDARGEDAGAVYDYVLQDVLAGTPRCFCDAANAPCSNPDAVGGCANSTGLGAQLSATGSTSIAGQAGDPLVLRVTGARPDKNCVWLQGATQQQVPFRDGNLCVGNPTIRLPGFGCGLFPIGTLDSSGALSTDDPTYGFDVVGAALCKGDDIAAAAPTTRDYQLWYRDGMGPCDTGSNLTNAVQVDFTP